MTRKQIVDLILFALSAALLVQRSHLIRATRLRSPTQTIRETAEKVLHTPSCRENARRIPKNFRRCGGAKEAAQTIPDAIRQ